MKRNELILTIVVLSSVSLLALRLSGTTSNKTDRPIVLIHGINSSSNDMETMKNELVKKGVDEKNIKLINLPENQGSIIKNAQYVGNEIIKISKEFGGKKVMVAGYSMGGEIADFLTKNQEEKVTYIYERYPTITIFTSLGSIRFKDPTRIETITEAIPMPTHMEKYIDEVVMIGSGPSNLAWIGYSKSLEDTSFLAYQDLTPNSYFQNQLNNMSPNLLIAYNTISGTNTWGTEEDDDVVPNEYSQRDYAKNNYTVDKASHTQLPEDSQVIDLVLQEKNNGALSNNEIRDILEYQKDQLTLQKNTKQYILSGILKDAPCGAKTTEITILTNEINSIGQQIAQIEGQMDNLSNE